MYYLTFLPITVPSHRTYAIDDAGYASIIFTRFQIKRDRDYNMGVSKLEKLRQLAAARKGGRLPVESDEEVDDIYDEVDEETYRTHKRHQLMEDDFVVDDNGEGYVDTGADEWDASTRPNYESDEEPSRKKRKPTKVTKVAPAAEISNYFKPTAAAVAPTVDADFDDILNDFGSVPKRRKVNAFAKSKPTAAPAAKNGFFSMKKKKVAVDLEEPVSPLPLQSPDPEPVLEMKPPSSPVATAPTSVLSPVKQSSPAPSPDLDSDDDIVVTRPRAAAAARPTLSTISSIKANVLALSPLRAREPAVQPQKKVDKAEITSGDTAKIFWCDYAEANGSLLLFGKVMTEDGKIVSGMVQVNGIHKELYFLPREGCLFDEVYDEVVPSFQQGMGLDRLRAKPEVKKYAFEIPGVPKETEYLKMLLPYQMDVDMPIPLDLNGRTFSRVFGTTALLFELFVMQRNVMGPCWLEISGCDFNSLQNASHCQVEIAVTRPELVTVLELPPPPPSLTLSSVSVQTRLDDRGTSQEVVAITVATYRDVPQDAPVDETLEPLHIVTLSRPVGLQLINHDLDARAKKTGFTLRTLPNEKVLLNQFAAIIKGLDPDVFIGHRLETVALDVIVHRMHHHKVPTWSALGRRNRKLWPDRFTRFNGKQLAAIANREIFQGRMLCDVANELGISLTPKCQLWDMPEMYQVVCQKKYALVEVNYDNITDPDYFMMTLQDTARQARIAAEIGFSIQILSLLKQLTNIAGNSWSATLAGTRSGRNEYILLHEFRRNNYILPDKGGARIQQAQLARVEGGDDDATTQTSNKKPKFTGGLVFDPVKGLHDNYTLVMDFNSLYPLIIQEFNICFTTVARDRYNETHDEQNDLPDYPTTNELGVLPRLLNTLVSRRREVKKLLKDPKNTKFQKAQYDIKQQALKLTANSMYGCLGFQNSRFYAKPLAMLVTNKGREILMDTRQLAELEALRVVYGDTDSVMINTGVAAYPDAIKIGEAFRQLVNEKYKLLEIDIDNVFKRLLLHAKKKYAAMNVTYDRATGTETLQLEVKGLDMRRREYCQLLKDVSTYVLEKILGELSETALDEIYSHLEKVAADVKANGVKLDKFRINTRLSKDPEKYPESNPLPHVAVALRLKKLGKVVKSGTVVSFIITAPTDESDRRSPLERARAFQEVLTDKLLRPDPQHYLEKQILAPVQRLLELIDGVDIVRVAECLGLDGSKYVHREAARHAIAPLEANLLDADRFQRCSHLVYTCVCGERFQFGGIQLATGYKMGFHGVSCAKCLYEFPILRLTAQLEYAIRRHLALYYAGWLACDDTLCGHTTRQIAVYGKRCLGTVGCKGVMRFQYTDRDIYNQLLYFNSLFDVEKAKKGQLKSLGAAEPLSQGLIEALSEQNRALFGQCQLVVEKYLSDCGRRYVNMGLIFEFLQ